MSTWRRRTSAPPPSPWLRVPAARRPHHRGILARTRSLRTTPFPGFASLPGAGQLPAFLTSGRRATSGRLTSGRASLPAPPARPPSPHAPGAALAGSGGESRGGYRTCRPRPPRRSPGPRAALRPTPRSVGPRPTPLLCPSRPAFARVLLPAGPLPGPGAGRAAEVAGTRPQSAAPDALSASFPCRVSAG